MLYDGQWGTVDMVDTRSASLSEFYLECLASADEADCYRRTRHAPSRSSRKPIMIRLRGNANPCTETLTDALSQSWDGYQRVEPPATTEHLQSMILTCVPMSLKCPLHRPRVLRAKPPPPPSKPSLLPIRILGISRRDPHQHQDRPCSPIFPLCVVPANQCLV